MRTEEEMFQLIVDVARKDERIRAVGMNGSRTNATVKKDIFQDYDIVYIVKDMQVFIDDPGWVDIFGERIIMQTPEISALFPPSLGGNFSYLMLFKDGNRIDLTLCPIERSNNWHRGDQLAKVLLDKDGILPEIPHPTNKQYWIKKPTQEMFNDCCTEFWWVSTYIVKGLWRQETLYAYDHLAIIRDMLLQMFEWKIGIETNFTLSIGKNRKYLQTFLSMNEWEALMATYPLCESEKIEESLFHAASLFEKISEEVAQSLYFYMDRSERERVKIYLKQVKKLPADARQIVDFSN